MELTLDIDAFKIKARTWGSNKGKTVLGIHGWLDNANSFEKIASIFSEDIYFVAIDLAGHGHSDHRSLQQSYYLWDYALDVIKVIETLQLSRVSIVAHSMGTGIASIVAGAMPELVEKMVFLDGLGAPFVIMEDDIVSHFSKSVKQLKMAKKTQLYGFLPSNEYQFISKSDAIHERMKNSIGVISSDASTCLVDRSIIQVQEGYRWCHDPRITLPECFRMTEHQAQSFISAISCKVLVILGKQGLFADGVHNSRLDKFQNAELHWIDGGHHLHLEERYKEIAELINKFL